jgi:hypothetical protein
MHWIGKLSSKKDNYVGISIIYLVQIYKLQNREFVNHKLKEILGDEVDE